MEKNPFAVIHMKNGARITIELFPEAAPNTVASFVYAASQGWLDHHAVERIVPGNWVDVSFTAFGREECRYLIPNEFSLHPEIRPLPSEPGCVCMGGYGEAGLAGTEFFFPLRECPEHLGVYPVFGRVTEGFEEVIRLSRVETRPFVHPVCPEVAINIPLEPQVMENIRLELNGYQIHRPVLMKEQKLPGNWGK